ncbi:uncharacterized protein K460DRAFT_369932 [Cucurbitaria berberidis CBS 394.84]|uniref:Pullulan synthetase n=1 Tax=Cucurbitaria berberidis CBS 394.84 TaxID=1168544 RepID=A0A9P4GAX7_9PLEO|nr:uncharacterized protein K460DRAFT_369932 [Cucurbitaria berberidis CBS 394.84]KAF1841914.1 hypothetical protein K460DRAFT_369932 [Cucurbitaria berberidis CBS 394.84]
MWISTLSVFAVAGASLCAALPTELTNFLLVTTSQLNPSANSSELKAVSATSLFDPFNQPALLLRLTGPGYGSLPNFTLTSGTLSTIASAPFGGAKYRYNSTVVAAGKELQFLASEQPAGNLALDEGYLLTVNGSREGWTICEGALSNDVLSWKGNGTTCEKTYVHAVTKAPY